MPYNRMPARMDPVGRLREGTPAKTASHTWCGVAYRELKQEGAGQHSAECSIECQHECGVEMWGRWSANFLLFVREKAFYLAVTDKYRPYLCSYLVGIVKWLSICCRLAGIPDVAARAL